MSALPFIWSWEWLVTAGPAQGVNLERAAGGGVRRIVTDSRTAGPGDLFVALRGERFDGHGFIPEVVSRGVTAVMVAETGRGCLPDGVPALVVADTRLAYGRIAREHRRRFELPMVCVGGSNGKTTTKDMIAALLSTRTRTLKSEASFNNDVGVPATLLRLNSEYGAAVLEAGTNHPGELAPLVQAISPRVGVITSLGREHLEFFGDIDGVILEEGMLAEGLPPGGLLVLDGDSPYSDAVVRRASPGVRVVRVGFGSHGDWQAGTVSPDWDGTSFRVDTALRPGWSGVWRLPLPGLHSVRNALAALAVAAELGVDPAAARAALAQFVGPPHRLVRSQAGGVRLLDDTYNANADSMLAALRTLTDLPCPGRRVAVLGDMGELGPMTETAHVEVGQASARGVDALFVIGKWAESTARAARDAGGGRVEIYPSVETALPEICRSLRVGDTVLVKASRAARLERVVLTIQTHFGPAETTSPQLAAA